MRYYSPTPAAVARARRLALRHVVSMAVVAAAVLVLPIPGMVKPGTREWQLVLGIVLAVFGYALWAAPRKAGQAFAAFRVGLDADRIEARPYGPRTVAIDRADVTSIALGRHGLIVRGRRGAPPIVIPRGVESYDDLVAELRTWREFEDAAPAVRRGTVLVYLLLGIFLAACAALYHSNRPPFVVPAVTALAALGTWLSVAIHRSPAVDDRAKLSTWFIVSIAVPALIWKLLDCFVEP